MAETSNIFMGLNFDDMAHFDDDVITYMVATWLKKGINYMLNLLITSTLSYNIAYINLVCIKS